MRKALLVWMVVGVLLAVTVSAFCAAQRAADWPGWRGPARDGKSPDVGLLKEWPAGGPKKLWQISGIGQGFSSMAVTGGMIYTSGIIDNQLVVTALDMTGKAVWRQPFGPECNNMAGSRSTPVIDSGRLYIVSGTGRVGCFDAKTGGPIWACDMREAGGRAHSWGYAESVLVIGPLAVVTPGGSNCIVALNKENGQSVWASRGFSAQAHYGSCIYVNYQGVPMVIAGTGGGILGVDARNGNLLWQNNFCAGNTANCPTPAFSDGYIFWSNGYGKGGICLKLTVQGNAVTAQEAWRTRDLISHHGGYIIHEGYVYGNHEGGWSCLDLKTGERKWNHNGVGKGSVIFADGMLCLFGESGGRAGIGPCSPNGFELRGQFQVQGKGPSWAYPVVVGGRLYLRYDDNLYCYDVRAGGGLESGN